MLVVLVPLDVAVQNQPVDPGAHVPEGAFEPPKAGPLVKLACTTAFDDLKCNIHISVTPVYTYKVFAYTISVMPFTV